MSGEVEPDYLLFRTATDVSAGQRMYGWNGPWPPPRFMTIITGPSGRDAVCETDSPGLTEDYARIIADADTGWRMEHFVLFSASGATKSPPKGSHWLRAAEYLPVED